MEYLNQKEIVYNDILPGFCYLFNDPAIGLEGVVGLCVDKSATGAVFLLDGETECLDPIPPRLGQSFTLIDRENSPAIRSQIRDLILKLDEIKAHAADRPFCEADMAKSIEESDSGDAVSGFLNEPNFPAAIFNSIPYILNRNKSSFYAFALILYAVCKCVESEDERYSHLDRYPYFRNQETLFDAGGNPDSEDENNIALLRRMGRYIKYSTRWPALFKGDTRFRAVVNNWNASKGYLSVLPQLSVPFVHENIIDERLDRLLSFSVAEVGTPEIEFTMCRNQSNVFPARIRLSYRTVRGIEAYNARSSNPITVNLEDRNEKPDDCNSDYPPVAHSDLQPTYQMILDWKNRTDVWTPVGTLRGTIESVEVIEKDPSNRIYTGHIRHKGSLLFFHSLQVIDQRIINRLACNSAVGIEVKFELAFNPARRKNIAPCADWIRLPDLEIDLPAAWTEPYDPCRQMNEVLPDTVRNHPDICSDYLSLQPWLPVYEGMVGGWLQGFISPDAAHYNQYYIREPNGKIYGFRHIQVWDEDLYTAMMSPARNLIDWEKIPVICLVVPDPTRPERMLADQVILTGGGRKALYDQIGLKMADNGTGIYLFSPRKDFIPQPVTQKKETDLRYGILDIITPQDREQTLFHGTVQSYYSINRSGKLLVDLPSRSLTVSYSQSQIKDSRLLEILEKQMYHKIGISFFLCYDSEGELVADSIRITDSEENRKILSGLSIPDTAGTEAAPEENRVTGTPAGNHAFLWQGNQEVVSFSGYVSDYSIYRNGTMFVDLRLDTPFYYLPESRYDTDTVTVSTVSLRMDKPFSVMDADLLDALSRKEHGLACKFQIATFILSNKGAEKERKMIAVNAELLPAERVRMGLDPALRISPVWEKYYIRDCLLKNGDIGYPDDLYHVSGWIVEATKNQKAVDEWYLNIALRRPIAVDHGEKTYAFSHATVNTSSGNWADQELLSSLKNKLAETGSVGRTVFEAPLKVSFYLKRPMFNANTPQSRPRLYACAVSAPEGRPETSLTNLLKFSDVLSGSVYLHAMSVVRTPDGNGYAVIVKNDMSRREYPLNPEKVIDTQLSSRIRNQDRLLERQDVLGILNLIDGTAEFVYPDQNGMVSSPTPVRYPICIRDKTGNPNQMLSAQAGSNSSMPEISGMPSVQHPYIKARRFSADKHWGLFNAHPETDHLRSALISDLSRFAQNTNGYRQVAYLAWLLWFDTGMRKGLRSAMGYAVMANPKQGRSSKLQNEEMLRNLSLPPWPEPDPKNIVPFLNFLFRLPGTVESFSETSLQDYPNWIQRIENYLGGELTESAVDEKRREIQQQTETLAGWINSLLYDEEEDLRKIDTVIPAEIGSAVHLLSSDELGQFNQFTKIMNGLKAIPSQTRASDKKAYIRKQYKLLKQARQETIDNPSLFATEVLYPAYEKLLLIVSRLFKNACGDEPVFNISTQCDVIPGSKEICVHVFVESSADSAAAHELSVKLLPKQEDRIFSEEEYLLMPFEPEVCQIDHLSSGESIQATRAGWRFRISDSAGVDKLHSFRLGILVDYSWNTLEKTEFNSKREMYLEVVPPTDCGDIKDPWNAVYPTTAQKDKAYVFGREKDLEKAFEKIWDPKKDEYKSCNIVIYGQRRMGKSTFAYLFKSRLEELVVQHPAIIAEPYDISGCLLNTDATRFDFDQLISHIIDGVTEELNEDIQQYMKEVNAQFRNKGIRGMEEFCTALKNACAEYNQDMPHIFITLDEFTTLFKPLSIHEEYRSTVAALLSLTANFPITLIMVAIDHYTSMIKYFSHARSHVEEFNIHGLSEEGGIQLLSLKAETDGNYVLSSPLISREYAIKLWKLAAGNPHIIISHFGHALVNYLNQEHIYRLETEEHYNRFLDRAFNFMNSKTLEDRLSPLTEDGRFCYDERVRKIHTHLNLIILNCLCEGMEESRILQIVTEEIRKCDEMVYHPVIEKLLSCEGVVIPENVLEQFRESKLFKDCHITAERLIEWLIERDVLQRDEKNRLQIVMPYYVECYNRKKEAMQRMASKTADF